MGLDPAGLAFGHAYGQTAQGLLDAGAAAVNARRGLGFGVRERVAGLRLDDRMASPVETRPVRPESLPVNRFPKAER